MMRFEPYLGLIAALVLGIFIVAFSGRVSVLESPPLTTIYTSPALFAGPSFALPPLTGSLPSLPQEAAPATTSIPVPAPVVSLQETVLPIPKVLSPPPAPSKLEISAITLRQALVNIICRIPARNGLYFMSGSGVIIDPQGTILTNAHVAQYFLLTHLGISCAIRTGGPAVDSYRAALIYIPTAWVTTNETILTQTNPKGTGEYDFALLAITKSASSSLPLPTSFPYVPLAKASRDIGTPVTIATYGAQLLQASQIQSSLFPTVVFSSVKDVFTFATDTIDVLALGGSSAAQEGSSGGGVADALGKLVGIITTSTVKGDITTRSLNAITASYIQAEYARETGQSLDLLLAEPTATAIANFAPQIPILEAILTAHLP